MPSMFDLPDQAWKPKQEEERRQKVKEHARGMLEGEALGPMELVKAVGNRVATEFMRGTAGFLQSMGERPEYEYSPLDTKGIRVPERYKDEPVAPYLAEMGQGLAEDWQREDISKQPWWQQRVIGGLGSAGAMLPSAFLGPVGVAQVIYGAWRKATPTSKRVNILNLLKRSRSHRSRLALS